MPSGSFQVYSSTAAEVLIHILKQIHTVKTYQKFGEIFHHVKCEMKEDKNPKQTSHPLDKAIRQFCSYQSWSR